MNVTSAPPPHCHFDRSEAKWRNLTSEWDKPINGTNTSPPTCHRFEKLKVYKRRKKEL